MLNVTHFYYALFLAHLNHYPVIPFGPYPSYDGPHWRLERPDIPRFALFVMAEGGYHNLGIKKVPGTTEWLVTSFKEAIKVPNVPFPNMESAMQYVESAQWQMCEKTCAYASMQACT